MKKDEAIATLIRYRIEQAEKIIEDAHCLLSGNGSPQSIINRSYYAMFYATLALMLRIGKSFAKHSGVISTFDKEFVHKGLLPKELSRHLHNAFESRQVSDYQAMDMTCREDAEEILKNAQVFVRTVEKYLKGLANGGEMKESL